MREPERLARLERRQLLDHAAVDRLVSRRKDQDQREERDRQKGDRGLGETDDDAGPLGVGDLLRGGEGHAAGREAGEEEPVHLHHVPGARVVARSEPEQEQDGAEDRETGADAKEEIVAAAHRAGDEPGMEVALAHRGVPPAAGAVDGAAGAVHRPAGGRDLHARLVARSGSAAATISSLASAPVSRSSAPSWVFPGSERATTRAPGSMVQVNWNYFTGISTGSMALAAAPKVANAVVGRVMRFAEPAVALRRCRCSRWS